MEQVRSVEQERSMEKERPGEGAIQVERDLKSQREGSFVLPEAHCPPR